MRGDPLTIGRRQGDAHALLVRGDFLRSYRDVFTPEVMAAPAALAPHNAPRRELVADRIQRRASRARDRHRIAFLDPATAIPGSDITVQAFGRDGTRITENLAFEAPAPPE